MSDYRIGRCQTAEHSIRNLRYDLAKACGKEVTRIYIMRNLKAHAISECHLRKCSYKTLSIQRIR